MTSIYNIMMPMFLFLLAKTEDEALAFALQASLADAPGSNIDVVPNSSDGTDEDLALARAIAQSELDERNRQRRGSRVSNSIL